MRSCECTEKSTEGLEEDAQRALRARMPRVWEEESSTFPYFSWTTTCPVLRRNKRAVLSFWQNPDSLVTDLRYQNGLVSPSMNETSENSEC